MSHEFPSTEAAFMALADPNNPGWGKAFAYLSEQPETAALMLEVFQETLEQLGVSPSGREASGEPVYTLEDVARALGVTAEEIERGLPQS